MVAEVRWDSRRGRGAAGAGGGVGPEVMGGGSGKGGGGVRDEGTDQERAHKGITFEKPEMVVVVA